MTSRYAIVSKDWQRFDRRYAVIDTQRHDRPILQTNDFGRAVQCRDEMNAEHEQREAARQARAAVPYKSPLSFTFGPY